MKGDRKFEQYRSTMFPMEEVETPADDRPGRSTEKIEERNEFIMYRKYWYMKTFRNIPWPVVKRQLAEELFLEEKTIENIVFRGDSEELMRQIMKEEPTTKVLAKKYWRVRWDLTIEQVMS
jgi:hypothetical protein